MIPNVKLDTEYDIPPQLMLAETLRSNGQLDEAMREVSKFLDDNFEDVPAIILAAHIMIDADRIGMAQALMKLASKIDPNSSLIWSDLGLCYQEGSDLEEGEKCFIKALQRDPNNVLALNNLAQLYNNVGQPMKAINCADKAIRVDPAIIDAEYNRGIAMLMLGNWEEGWKGYENNLGKHRGRAERVYGMTPRWTGVKGLTVVAYGEQGIGDEISFASCIPDLMKDNRVVIDCDKRLAGLFRRSFDCPVYGTRREQGIAWPKKHNIDASVAMGSLPMFYRKSDSDFTGEPYLKADPLRRLQWRAALDSLGSKKKIGIAWTGGLKKTGAQKRSLALDDFIPILQQDATFISLQYKDAPEIAALEKERGIKIHHWPHAMQTGDYDDTAALVAELDLVICVTQSAVHLAGALGVPCWALTPKAPMWRYRLAGEFLWANSVKLYRQKSEWVYTIADVAKDLRDFVK